MVELSICQIGADEISQLADLWQACFTDDPPEYAQGFIRSLPENAIVLAGKVAASVVSMLFLLPATAEFRDMRLPVRYLYAGCTHPHHRSKGYYRRLMDAAAKAVREIGEYAIYLHPADEALDAAYRRMGYLGGIMSDRHTLIDSRHFTSVIEAEYKHKRREILSTIAQNTVVWDLNKKTTDLFMRDALAIGANMTADNDGVSLIIGDSVIERISPIKTLDRKNICLWLPVQASPLNETMTKFSGYTGIIGD